MSGDMNVSVLTEAAATKELGMRFNTDKVMLGLISSLAKEGCARVLMFGMLKYDSWNWMKGLPISETLDSLERHMDKLRQGERIDSDSGLPHVDHIQCNAMFVSHFHHSGMWEDLDKDMPPEHSQVEYRMV